MRRPSGGVLVGLTGAVLAMGGGLVALGMLTDGTKSAPTVSGTLTGGTEPSPTSAYVEFNPTPDVCLDSLEPPPCAEQAVSYLTGALELAPTRFTETFPAFPGIQTRVEAGRGPSESSFPPPNPADFEARAWDAQGREVPGVSLDLTATVAEGFGAPEVDSSEYFLSVDIFLPGTAGFTRVELFENDTVVREWTAGPRAPEIESLTMTDGPDGPLIEWAATDADGDDLEYTVWLVDANGDRNLVILGVTTETSMFVNWNDGHGPGPHRAFVTASDGINTFWAVTDPLQMANQRPYFGFSVDTEYTMTPRGSLWVAQFVRDPEGEELSSQIVWTSSIDGYLTTGSDFRIFNGSVEDGPEISVGRHLITASVTDSGGATGSVSFTLVVGP